MDAGVPYTYRFKVPEGKVRQKPSCRAKFLSAAKACPAICFVIWYRRLDPCLSLLDRLLSILCGPFPVLVRLCLTNPLCPPPGSESSFRT